MAYCTYADLVERYGVADLASYADYDGDGTADADAVAAAISDSDAHLNSYLAVKYVVPISPVPDVLVKRSTTLSMYFLQLRRDSVTEDMHKEYDRVMRWVADLLAGKAQMGAATQPTESPGAGGVDYEVRDRVFGRDEPL